MSNVSPGIAMASNVLTRLGLNNKELLAVGIGLVFEVAQHCRKGDAELDARLKAAGADRANAMLVAEIFIHHLNTYKKPSSESTAVEA